MPSFYYRALSTEHYRRRGYRCECEDLAALWKTQNQKHIYQTEVRFSPEVIILLLFKQILAACDDTSQNDGICRGASRRPDSPPQTRRSSAPPYLSPTTSTGSPTNLRLTRLEEIENKCMPNSSWNDDLPPGFATNSTPLCGITWPQGTPLTNISDCCSPNSSVEVSHACFHYCQTDLEPVWFLHCAAKRVSEEHIGARCNRAADRGSWLPPSSSWVPEVLRDPSSLLLICIVTGILLICLAKRHFFRQNPPQLS